MIKLFVKYILIFIFLILIQVIVLDNINFFGIINPYLFILFIIILPFEVRGWFLLFIGFFLGLFIDIFNNTPGLHASATVFISFLRPKVLKIIAPRGGYEPGTFPRIYYFGFNWFLKYLVILTVAHHIVYYFLEAFSFHDFFLTICKIILSSIFTLILIILSQFLISKN
ncbi:MAG: rod shape-determining protein MreD [Bacteroidia bacterium]|nr:rod shape-determining protein MreD [Bacteroidia bacterium]